MPRHRSSRGKRGEQGGGEGGCGGSGWEYERKLVTRFLYEGGEEGDEYSNWVMLRNANVTFGSNGGFVDL